MKVLRLISFVIINCIAITLLVILTVSCSKKVHHGIQTIYSVDEINAKLIQANVKENPEATKALVLSEYGPGARTDSSRGLEYKGLTFFIIQFEDEESAKVEAKRLHEVNVGNWLFDHVSKEPILFNMIHEHFLKKGADDMTHNRVIHH